MIIFFMLLILISYVVYYNFSVRVNGHEAFSILRKYDKDRMCEILTNNKNLEPMDQCHQYNILLEEAKESNKIKKYK